MTQSKPIKYRLIPATEQDRPWLERLRRAVYRDLFIATWGDWDEGRHVRQWAAAWDRGDISLIEVAGERVGTIQLFEHDDALEVGEIQIQPAHQNQGLGTRVLSDVIERARLQGQVVRLSTGLHNRAVRLYERLGFRHVLRTETHFHLEWAPAVSGV